MSTGGRCTFPCEALYHVRISKDEHHSCSAREHDLASPWTANKHLQCRFKGSVCCDSWLCLRQCLTHPVQHLKRKSPIRQMGNTVKPQNQLSHRLMSFWFKQTWQIKGRKKTAFPSISLYSFCQTEERKTSTDLKPIQFNIGLRDMRTLVSAVPSVARTSSWPGLGCPLVELQERNSAFWKEDNNSFPKHCFGFLQGEVWRVPDIFVCC